MRWVKRWLVVLVALACTTGCDRNGQSALARVEKLEKQMAALRSGITTKSLAVVGDDGRRLDLGSDHVWLFDKNGKERLSLGLAGDNPTLLLLDKTGLPRARLDLMDGNPALFLWDKNAQIVVQLPR